MSNEFYTTIQLNHTSEADKVFFKDLTTYNDVMSIRKAVNDCLDINVCKNTCIHRWFDDGTAEEEDRTIRREFEQIKLSRQYLSNRITNLNSSKRDLFMHRIKEGL